MQRQEHWNCTQIEQDHQLFDGWFSGTLWIRLPTFTHICVLGLICGITGFMWMKEHKHIAYRYICFCCFYLHSFAKTHSTINSHKARRSFVYLCNYFTVPCACALSRNSCLQLQAFLYAINKHIASACVTLITLAWGHQRYQNCVQWELQSGNTLIPAKL